MIIKQWGRLRERCGSTKKRHHTFSDWTSVWPHYRATGTFSTILCIIAHFKPLSWDAVSTVRLKTTKTVTCWALCLLLKSAKSESNSEIIQWFRMVKQYQRPCVKLRPCPSQSRTFLNKRDQIFIVLNADQAHRVDSPAVHTKFSAQIIPIHSWRNPLHLLF